MRTLVVYYSLQGNTRSMAEAMAAQLGADLLPLKPLREMPTKGFRKFLWGGRQVLMKEAPDLQPLAVNPADYKRLVIGTPVWAGSYAPTLRTYFLEQPVSDKSVALFCCHGGGKGRVFQRMRDMLAANEVVGEIDFVEPIRKGLEAAQQRAREWAKGLWPA